MPHCGRWDRSFRDPNSDDAKQMLVFKHIWSTIKLRMMYNGSESMLGWWYQSHTHGSCGLHPAVFKLCE